jgi:hypothetical protein
MANGPKPAIYGVGTLRRRNCGPPASAGYPWIQCAEGDPDGPLRGIQHGDDSRQVTRLPSSPRRPSLRARVVQLPAQRVNLGAALLVDPWTADDPGDLEALPGTNLSLAGGSGEPLSSYLYGTHRNDQNDLTVNYASETRFRRAGRRSTGGRTLPEITLLHLPGNSALTRTLRSRLTLPR